MGGKTMTKRYTRQDLVDETVESFVEAGEFKPSDTDIRLVSNDVGEGYVDEDLMTHGQWERISQSRTVEMVRRELKKRR